MINRDGHVRVLPLHVANKIAAGEVVERPASVVKELVENAIDAGARKISISVTQGGRKLVAVQDDGCGMSRDDAVLSLERQATSKILDVEDIEQIDTLGFRGEAIPSIASVSRFSITTRRADSDEGTFLQVNAGVLAEVRSAGCPVGTLVEVRDLFCNVPARRKFLRAYVTEENHVKTVFTVHALAHPRIGFSLTVDGRELYRLAPAENLTDRVRDLFGSDFIGSMRTIPGRGKDSAAPVPRAAPAGDAESLPLRQSPVAVSGLIEIPNLSTPTRRDQYVFINGRPATSPSVAYALREAYPHRQGDLRPAAILFLDLPPNQVDVNVHPTKREVRFRDNVAVKQAIIEAIGRALTTSALPPSQRGQETAAPVGRPATTGDAESLPLRPEERGQETAAPVERPATTGDAESLPLRPEERGQETAAPVGRPATTGDAESFPLPPPPLPLRPAPIEVDLPLAAADGETPRPWNWFKFLALTASGYLLIETDSGVVTINPHAARERIAFEALLATDASAGDAAGRNAVQSLLIPEIVKLSPPDFARVKASLDTIVAMGFAIEEFGTGTFKIDAVPQLIGELSPATIIQTIARDLADGSGRRGGNRWREELIARSVAKSFAGMSLKLTEEGAVRLVEELAATRVPYICPRGKPIMIFTSTRELDRKFAK